MTTSLLASVSSAADQQYNSTVLAQGSTDPLPQHVVIVGKRIARA